MSKEDNHVGFFRSMLSEGKQFNVSSKRVIGLAGFMFAMFCIGFDVINCDTVCISSSAEELLQTLLIMCASLLGINSVASIFSNQKDTKNKNDNGQDVC